MNLKGIHLPTAAVAIVVAVFVVLVLHYAIGHR